MKKIISILVALIMCFTLSSCITTVQAQADGVYDDVDISVVVRYGTPYYNTEGLLLYYIYRDMFYYPYYCHNRYYLHRYHRPLPPQRMRRYKPVPRDFYNRNKAPHRYSVTPPNRSTQHIYPNRKYNHKPNTIPRNNINVRPNINRNTVSRTTNNHGRHGSNLRGRR